MNIIEPQSSGDAVEDVQMRLVSLGLLTDDNVTGTFDETTARAIAAFRRSMHLPECSGRCIVSSGRSNAFFALAIFSRQRCC